MVTFTVKDSVTKSPIADAYALLSCIVPSEGIVAFHGYTDNNGFVSIDIKNATSIASWSVTKNGYADAGGTGNPPSTVYLQPSSPPSTVSLTPTQITQRHRPTYQTPSFASLWSEPKPTSTTPTPTPTPTQAPTTATQTQPKTDITPILILIGFIILLAILAYASKGKRGRR